MKAIIYAILFGWQSPLEPAPEPPIAWPNRVLRTHVIDWNFRLPPSHVALKAKVTWIGLDGGAVIVLVNQEQMEILKREYPKSQVHENEDVTFVAQGERGESRP